MGEVEENPSRLLEHVWLVAVSVLCSVVVCYFICSKSPQNFRLVTQECLLIVLCLLGVKNSGPSWLGSSGMEFPIVCSRVFLEVDYSSSGQSLNG